MLSVPQTILITGGTSGIGLALVNQLHDEGHNIVIVARNVTKFKQLLQYKNLNCYPCDLASRQQVEALCNDIIENHPDISIIINNAGIQYTPCFVEDEFNFDSIEHETRVNFLAPAWITYLLLPALINNASPSAIVNISSGLALAPKTHSAIYCATKSAIHSLSQSLRYQLAESNVRVMEVLLPLVDTPMTTGRGRNKLSPKEAAAQIICGVKSEKNEIYVGKARFLPLLMRISPTLVKNMLRRS